MRGYSKPEEMGKSLRIKQVTSCGSPHPGTDKQAAEKRFPAVILSPSLSF